MAARIRGRQRLQTPGAILAATAVCRHATGLVTNDPVFQRLEAFETLVFDRLR